MSSSQVVVSPLNRRLTVLTSLSSAPLCSIVSSVSSCYRGSRTIRHRNGHRSARMHSAHVSDTTGAGAREGCWMLDAGCWMLDARCRGGSCTSVLFLQSSTDVYRAYIHAILGGASHYDSIHKHYTNTSDSLQHMNNVRRVTQHLVQVIIPTYANSLGE